MKKIIILLMYLMIGTITIYGQARNEFKNNVKNNVKNNKRDKPKYDSNKDDDSFPVYCPICGKRLYNPRLNTSKKKLKSSTWDYVCKEHNPKKIVSVPYNYPFRSKYPSIHEVKNSCYRKDSIKTDDGVIYTITNLCKNTLYFYIESLNICCILNHQKTSSPIKTNPPIVLKLTHNEKVWKDWVPSGTRIIE